MSDRNPASPDPDGPGPDGSRPDGVVVFGGIDWWYHNLGHSDVQIAKQLVRDHKVLWVNSIGMRAPTPGKTDLVVTRYLRKLKSTLRTVRTDPSGIKVMSPLFLPAYSEAAIRRNGALVNGEVRLVLKTMGIKNPAAFITVPTAVDAVLGRPYTRVVFNRSDVFSAFPDVDTETIGRAERRLLHEADEVMFVNHGLMDLEGSETRAHRFLGHGVDVEHFASARPLDGPPRNPPAALADLPRPIIGFYGALDDYTVDLDLFVQVARRLPEASIVVIGPKQMDIGALDAVSNIHYLGPIPYPDLPAHAAEFDVGLMPWLQTEWIERCNPIKLKEYLALGFPVVSTPFPELAPYLDFVVAAPAGEFAEQVARVVAEGPFAAEDVRRRRQLMGASTWEAIGGQVASALRL
jgi:glycosyltransferase involved in cell wall biosynthesis